ncbi:hypothetical protein P154DRAFT_516866 [Amniculicola lignicola CBS 123094]|uniref:Heterokaryon incompatibility domain-containing protein n=1 Tax=Amniculicola lignicola CBS 123094 TaxID=1392246 RepID=A0A6A5X585_9PLEO|nr:hypothetical protein P154DRAFT_516866 [Amniculicola lignicola CBS 123094]
MDHISVPKDALEGIRVPRLIRLEYQSCGPIEDIFWKNNPDTAQLATLLQSRLYFGFLDAFFKQHIDIEDFSIEDDNQAYISSTEGLDLLISTNISDRAHQHKTLEKVSQQMRDLETRQDFDKHRYPLSEVEISIRVLISTLAHYCGWKTGKDWTFHPLLASRLKDAGWCRSQIKTIAEYQDEAMVYYLSLVPSRKLSNNGHEDCPNTHCTASNVKNLRPYENKHTCRGIPIKSSQALENCPLIQVSGSKIRQVINSGGIPLISIEISPSGDIALHVQTAQPSDRYVAMSHVWSDGLGNPNSNALPKCQVRQIAAHLEDLPYPSSKRRSGDVRPVLSYGSISIDFTRLSISMRKPSRPKLFWMDTLCIPVGQDKLTHELKNKAINHMAFIYGQASQVLVLDAALQESKLANMSKREVLAKIYYSNWMGRSWTYQEGSLTPYVYFQFADGALSPLASLPDDEEWSDDSIEEFLWSSKIPTFRTTTSKAYQSLLHRISVFGRQKRHFTSTRLIEFSIYKQLYANLTLSLHLSHLPEWSTLFSRLNKENEDPLDQALQLWIRHFCTIWNALRTRSTTKAEDAPIILANLLGYQSYHVLRYPPEERLKVMLLSAEVLPLALLYNTGSRLTEQKGSFNKWIPKTLGREAIPELPLMFLDPSRGISIDRARGMTYASAPTILLLTDPQPYDQHHFCINYNNEILHVEGFRSPEGIESEVSRSPTHKNMCLLFHPSTGHGCLLRLSMRNHHSSSYTALYDCPIRVHRRSPRTEQVVALCVAHESPPDDKHWSITITNDTKNLPVLPRIRRAVSAKTALNAGEDVGWFITVASWSTPLILILLATTILRLIIAVNLGWSEMSAFGRASIISFGLQRLPTPLMLLPVSQALFIVDKKGKDRRGWSDAERAYVVLDLFWILYLMFLIPLLMHRWMMYRFHLQLGVWDERGKGLVDMNSWLGKIRKGLFTRGKR